MEILPELPVNLFLVIPIIFIFLVAFTCIRYSLQPIRYIGHVAVFSSLVVGFIFLYAMQKYDRMDANVPVVERNILFLANEAQKYDPSATCLLIDYIEAFLNFENDTFPIIEFERKILPFVTDENEIFRIREAVTILELIGNERITRSNLIAEPIWYVVLISITILTIIFPLDASFERSIDSILVIILIWFPIYIIYYLYRREIDILTETMENLMKELKFMLKKKGIKCSRNHRIKCHKYH